MSKRLSRHKLSHSEKKRRELMDQKHDATKIYLLNAFKILKYALRDLKTKNEAEFAMF